MATRFFLDDLRIGKAVEIDFSDFIYMVKGSAIYSGAANGEQTFKPGVAKQPDFIEFGLTDMANMRVQALPDGLLHVSLTMTLNEHDIPPIRLQIFDGDDAPLAALVEHRIKALRQAFAISMLVEAERAEEVSVRLLEDDLTDLEAMLAPEDRLYIRSAGPGSLWLTIAAKTASAYKTLKYGLALPFEEGRRIILRRLEADTRIAEAAADEKEFDITLKRIEGITNISNKIDKVKDERARKVLKNAYFKSLKNLEISNDYLASSKRQDTN